MFARVGIRTYPACALQGIAARWLSAHYKNIARSIARAIARGLGFVTPCPNKQGKNAYFSKVSDASGTASDVANVRKDCQCGVARQALMEKGREFESAFGARP